MDGRRAKGARNREQLMEAALRLFREHGYADTTVDDIVAAAGVSQRTFFHHFPTKEAVLFDQHEDRLADVTTRFRALSGEPLHIALFAVGMEVVDSIEARPELFLQRFALYREVPTLRATMLRINEDWIDSLCQEIAVRLGRDPAIDPRPRLAATLVNSANRVGLEIWSRSGGTIDLRQAVADALDTSEPALRRIEQLPAAGLV